MTPKWRIKGVVIGFAIGWAVGIASAAIGLRQYANDPLLRGIEVTVPGPIEIIRLAIQGSALIWIGIFAAGLLIVVAGWVMNEVGRRRR